MYENQELLTRAQAAEFLAVSVDTIDRMAESGELTKRYLRPAVDVNAPAYMMGTLPRFRKAELQELVEKRFGGKKC